MGKYIENITLKLLCGHEDCIYAANLGDKKAYCNYLEIVGHKRNCKPNAECSCYKVAKGAK